CQEKATMDNVVSIPVSLFTYSRFIESKQQLNMPDSTNDEFMLMLLDHITSCDIHMNGSAQSHSGAASMASGTGAGAASDAKQPDDAPASEAASTAAQQTGAIALVSPFSGSSAVAPPPAKQNEGADAGSNLTCQMCGYTCAEEKDFNLHIANHISQLSSIMAAQTPQQPQLDQQAAARPPAQQSAQPVSASMVERKYQCNICGARFKQQRILEQHIDGMHSTTGKYACDSCGQTFKWPGKFYSHKRVCNGQQQQQPPPPPPPLAVSTGSVVNGLPPLHRCQKCDTLFVSLASLGQHACAGSAVPPQQQQQQLNLHPHRQQQQQQSIVLVPPRDAADATLKQHPCPECSKRFRTKTLLDQHMHLHRPPAYQCRYCSRKFRWPPVFYQHQRQCKLNPSVVAASAAGGNGNSRSHGNNSRRKSYTPVKAPEPAAPMRPPVSLSAAAVTPESESAGLSLLRDASSDNSIGGVVSNAANYRCACTAVFASVKAYLNHCDSCPEHSGRGQQQLEQQQQQAQVGSIVDAASLSQLAPSVAGGYTCPQCNNTYSSRLSLKQHIEGMHSIEARYECDGCRKRFRWGASYYCHKKTCSAYKAMQGAGGADSQHLPLHQLQPPPLQFSLVRQSAAAPADAELDNGEDDDEEEEEEDYDDEAAVVEDADMAIDLTESAERRQRHQVEFDGSSAELQA
ncbi:hypothetical protein BOX15_Mlig008468g2, partial [Macrostomum lignano]